MQLIPDDLDWDAYESAPEVAKIHPAKDYVDGVVDSFYGPGASPGARLPWDKFGSDFGIRPSEVTLWAGVNGHGKSLVTSEVCLTLMKQDEPSLILSFEMTPTATMSRMVRQAAGNAEPTIDFIRRFAAWTDGRLWIFDHHGAMRAARVLAVLRYAQAELGIRQFFIDSLMKCGIDSEDYNGQKRFVDDLCGFAMQTGAHVHLVAHARKGARERDGIDKFGVKGASEITDQVDNVVLVQRNKAKEEDLEENPGDEGALAAHDLMLTVAKQRHGSWEGSVRLWLDQGSKSFVESRGERPRGMSLNGGDAVEI